MDYVSLSNPWRGTWRGDCKSSDSSSFSTQDHPDEDPTLHSKWSCQVRPRQPDARSKPSLMRVQCDCKLFAAFFPGNVFFNWPKLRCYFHDVSLPKKRQVGFFPLSNQGTESLRSTFFGISCLSLTPPPQSRSSTFNSTTGRWMSGHERVRGKHGTRGATSTKVLKALDKQRERESYHELSIPYHRFSHWPTKHFLAWPAFILYKAIYHSVAVHTHPCVKCAIHRSDRTGEILLWQRVFSWEKGGEGSWNDVPNIGYNDTQTKHIQTSSLVGHVIPTALPFRTNFTKVDWSNFSWKKHFCPHEFGKPVVVTFAHAGTGMTDFSEMVQCMRSGGFPKPAYIDGWLVGQNPQNIHTIHTPSVYAKDLQVVCKSSVNTPPVYANLDHGLLSDQPKRWSGSVSVKIWDEKF